MRVRASRHFVAGLTLSGETWRSIAFVLLEERTGIGSLPSAQSWDLPGP